MEGKVGGEETRNTRSINSCVRPCHWHYMDHPIAAVLTALNRDHFHNSDPFIVLHHLSVIYHADDPTAAL